MVLGIESCGTPAKIGAAVFFLAALFDIFGRLTTPTSWPSIVASALVALGFLLFVASAGYGQRRAADFSVWRSVPWVLIAFASIPFVVYHMIVIRAAPDLRAMEATNEFYRRPEIAVPGVVLFLSHGLYAIFASLRDERRYQRTLQEDVTVLRAKNRLPASPK